MASIVGHGRRTSAAAAFFALAAVMLPTEPLLAQGEGLWSVYQSALKNAKYVDLTHTIKPTIPVWAGLGA
jgi:hypothetical protein